MNVGDLVMIIPECCVALDEPRHCQPPETVGIITERDDNYEAKRITGNLVNLVKVQFGDELLWFDTDQVEVLDESR